MKSGFGDKAKEVVYLIGDFRKATVFVGQGDLKDVHIPSKFFEKPSHDVDFNDVTYRFWNAEERFLPHLARRDNTYIFPGDNSGLQIEINERGDIYFEPVV